MNTVMISFWKNDFNRRLLQRAGHLLEKKGVTRWIWSIGDCQDPTWEALESFAYEHHPDKDIQLFDSSTFIVGNDMPTRLRRLSVMATKTFTQIRETDDCALVHESDLESPVDLLDRFFAAGRMPIAGWPVLNLGGRELFYDIWAYHRFGEQFTNSPPYHFAYLDRTEDVIEVDGFGSVWLTPAYALHNMVVEEEAVREICRKLKADGHRLWVDTTIKIRQPQDLWEAHTGTPLRKP